MKTANFFLILCIVLVVAVGLIYISRNYEQTRFIYDNVSGAAVKIKTYVMSNIPTVVAASGGLTAIGGYALSAINKAKAKVTEASNAKAAVESQVSSLQAAKDQAAAKLAAAEQNLPELQQRAAEAELNADEATKLVTQLKSENERLLQSNTDLMKMVQNKEVQVVKVPV